MPCPQHATALHGDSTCGSLGPAMLPISSGRMGWAWGRLALSPLSVTLCPLGSKPIVLGYSFKKSVIKCTSFPLQRASICNMGAEIMVTCSILPPFPGFPEGEKQSKLQTPSPSSSFFNQKPNHCAHQFIQIGLGVKEPPNSPLLLLSASAQPRQ